MWLARMLRVLAYWLIGTGVAALVAVWVLAILVVVLNADIIYRPWVWLAWLVAGAGVVLGGDRVGVGRWRGCLASADRFARTRSLSPVGG